MDARDSWHIPESCGMIYLAFPLWRSIQRCWVTTTPADRTAVAAAATIVQLIFRSVVSLDIQCEFLVMVGKMDLGWEQESAAQKEYHKQIYCRGLGFFCPHVFVPSLLPAGLEQQEKPKLPSKGGWKEGGLLCFIPRKTAGIFHSAGARCKSGCQTFMTGICVIHGWDCCSNPAGISEQPCWRLA